MRNSKHLTFWSLCLRFIFKCLASKIQCERRKENKKERNVDRQMLLFWRACGVLGNMERPSRHGSRVSKELFHPSGIGLFHSFQRKGSTKEFQLAGSRNKVFSVISPALWNILTLEMSQQPPHFLKPGLLAGHNRGVKW